MKQRNFSRLLLSGIFTLIIAHTGWAQTTQWKVDRSHSLVKFIVTHMVISEVEGNFKVFDK